MAKKKINNNKIVTYLLFAALGIFVITIVLPFLGGLIATINPNKAMKMAKQQQAQNEPVAIDDSWQVVTDSRGYTVQVPDDWYVLTYEGEIQQIQNWDTKQSPYTTKSSIEGDMSKWDVFFSTKPFVSKENVLAQKSEDIDVVSIETSRTAGGNNVYFITGTSYLFSTIQKPRIVAIVEDGDEYFSWNAIYSGNEAEAQILKDIVRSIRQMP